jgi:ankyrin repeat protein
MAMAKTMLPRLLALLILLAGVFPAVAQTASDRAPAELLLAAVTEDRADIVQVLLRNGFDPDAIWPETGSGTTALIRAAERGSLAAMAMLLRQGADPDQANRENWTPLMEAADKSQPGAVRLLVDAGADLEAQETRGGKTALMVAARSDSATMVALLLDSGTDVGARSASNGMTALHFALQSRRDSDPDDSRGAAVAVITELLAAGADVNQAADDGWTPLMSAVANGETDRVRLMLDSGAGLQDFDHKGRTALALAAENGNGTLVDLLIVRGAAQDLVGVAPDVRGGQIAAGVASGSLEIVRKLAEAGLPLEAENIIGRHPLTLAGGSGFDDIVDYLLAGGFPPDLRNSSDGSTALMWAANGGHIQIVQALLDAGADPTLRDNSGWTAIEAAEMAGHDDIAAILRDGA